MAVKAKPKKAAAGGAGGEARPPLKATTNAAGGAGAGAGGGGGAKGKSVEEIYQKKTQLEHILLRPDSYSAWRERGSARGRDRPRSQR